MQRKKRDKEGQEEEETIFSVIRNYWRRGASVSPPSSSVSKLNNSYEPKKEHRDVFQNTYSNFDSNKQVYPDELTRKRSHPPKTTDELFFDYCSEATIHGVRHLGPSSNRIRRFLYLVIVLVFTGILLNFLLGVLVLYFDHPYKTYYFAKVMKTLDFPSVTMCNVENVFDVQLNYSDNTTLDEVMSAYLTPSINIASCSYNGENCSKATPTVMVIRKKMFGCYIIRPSINRTFDIDDLMTNDGLYVDIQTKRNSFNEERGVRVFLHEDKTFPSQMDSSFFAGPHDATFAVIQPQKVVKLGVPYHPPDEDCKNNDSPDFINPLKFFKFYSQTNCQRECTSRYVQEVCNCSIAYFPGKARPCTVYDYDHCLKMHMEASLSQFNFNTRCKCLPNCSYLQYDSRISATKISYRRSKEDMFRIRIYFENMVMKFLWETPKYELDDLLASFGGQMGLFLGASVISVYEFIEFLVILIWNRFYVQSQTVDPQFKRTTAMRKKTPRYP